MVRRLISFLTYWASRERKGCGTALVLFWFPGGQLTPGWPEPRWLTSHRQADTAIRSRFDLCDVTSMPRDKRLWLRVRLRIWGWLLAHKGQLCRLASFPIVSHHGAYSIAIQWPLQKENEGVAPLLIDVYKEAQFRPFE